MRVKKLLAASLLLGLAVSVGAIAAERKRAPVTREGAQQQVPKPPQIDLRLSCATKGYTCASGFSCTIESGSMYAANTTLIKQYRCVKGGASCSGGCPAGYTNGGPAGGGGFKCMPVGNLCKSGTTPWPNATGSGYHCVIPYSG